jgi:hypothetical protein
MNWKEYQEYIKDNPKGYWFKAKLYGWGWTPVKWQGWVIIGVFIVAILLLSSTVEDHASGRDMMFTFFLPLVSLVMALLWICYKTGEPPRWRWGPEKK